MKPRPEKLTAQLAQVDASIRVHCYRQQNTTLSDRERITLGVVIAAMHERRNRLIDLIKWEQELAS